MEFKAPVDLDCLARQMSMIDQYEIADDKRS